MLMYTQDTKNSIFYKNGSQQNCLDKTLQMWGIDCGLTSVKWIFSKSRMFEVFEVFDIDNNSYKLKWIQWKLEHSAIRL